MYAQRDMTAVEVEEDRLMMSDDYRAGIEEGWRRAEAFHWIPSTRTESEAPNHD